MDDFKSRISLSATDRFTSDSGIQIVHWIYSFCEIPMGQRKKPGIEILGFVR
jgi:hypothetical protein